MTPAFEELDRRETPIGVISVRRRRELVLDVDVYEVKLDDDFLMSSLFTVAETELSRLALGRLDGTHLDVVVGGLGLGYTARAVLADPRVRSLHVVEALDAVIDWHNHELLPLSSDLVSDPRCRFVTGDFFAILAAGETFGPHAPERCDAILVDIDHTPRHVLHPSHAEFYEAVGQRLLTTRLSPGGVFALWSDAPPDHQYMSIAEEVFGTCEAHRVSFPNPYTGAQSANTVYIASTPGRQPD